MAEETAPNPQKKTASLDDILEAVAKKESVVRTFSGKKTLATDKTETLKKLILSFTQGILFGLGFVLVVGAVFFIALKLNQLNKVNLIFYKLVFLLRSLGN